MRHDAAEATLHPPRSKSLGIALILLLNLGLLGGSAWLVYTLLAQSQSAAEAPTVQLGTPRLFPLRAASKVAKTAALSRKRPATKRPTAKRHTTKRHTKGSVPLPSPTPKTPLKAPVAAQKDLAAPKPGDSPAATRTAGRPRPTDAGAPPAKAKLSPDAAAESPADRRRAQINAGSIRLVVRHHLPQIQACYERATKRGQRVGGMIEVRFVLSPTGQVSRSQVHSNTTGSSGLGVCIAATMGRWKFPRPVGGEVEFIYPFVFSSSR